MADVTVTTAVDLSFMTAFGQHGVVWDDSHDVGYFFFTDDASPRVARFVKTLDGGATFEASVQLNDDIDIVTAFSVWADWDTPGISGTLIHFVYYSGNSNKIIYGNLDVTDDTQGTEVNISGTLSDAPTNLGITKSRGGELSVIWNSSSAVTKSDFFISDDDGATWENLLDPWGASATDPHEVYLYPSDETDLDDLWAVVQDNGADELQFWNYDRSANTWSSEAIVTSWITVSGNMGTGLSHTTRHLWVIGISGNPFGVAADIRVWEIGGSGAISEKTVVLTSDDYLMCDIMLDQNTDDVYVGYGRGADANNLIARSKVSRDGGSTWEAEVTQGDGTTYVLRRVDLPPGVTNRGRLLVLWYDQTADDILTNIDNAVDLGMAPGGGGSAGLLQLQKELLL